VYASSSTLGSMRYDGNTVVGEPRESLGVDKVVNSFFLLFLSSRCLYVLDNPVSQGDSQRILGLKECDGNQARPAGSSDATPDSAIWPRYQDIDTGVKSVLVRLVNR
jgi:hypothetical protein